MPGQKNRPSGISSKAIRSLKARIQSAFGSDDGDPVANPILLKRLTSYASIVTKKNVLCKWGEEHKTNLDNEIILNPFDPTKNTAPVDRKIILDAVLEHEIRCHWQHTPRHVFEEIASISENRSPISEQDYWKTPEHFSRLNVIKHLFNILEDGRTETRVRWERPNIYEIIAAGDKIRPRWESEPVYRPAQKVYRTKISKLKNQNKSKCKQCGQDNSFNGLECESCFTEQYRWEQITGILLLAALPPHVPPLDIVESEVRSAFQECFPLVKKLLRGTATECKHFSLEILKILIKHKMVPPQPIVGHLRTNDASGHPDAKDTPMPPTIAHQAGLNQDSNRAGNPETNKNQDKQNQEGDRDDKQPQNEQKQKDKKPEAGGASKLSQEENNPEAQNSPGSAKNETNPELENLANRDLQNFDADVDLDLEKFRREAQNIIDSIQYDRDSQKAHDLIMGVSGSGAGPGIDRNIRRVAPNKNVYEILRTRNLELGKRFAREIDDLVHSLSQNQRYQRAGRLDRKQLVNAVARGKNTVFIRPRIHYQLDLAVIFSIDLSGSMSAYNKPVSLLENHRPSPAQLADAVTICSIGFVRLKVPYEVRAFGSYQWLVKGFYDRESFGIGGMAGKDDGGTDMLPAVEYAAIAMFGRQEKDRLIVIMTDGWPANVEETTKKIQFARLHGNQVLGILFDYGTKKRDQSDPAMSRLFGPSGFTVIHTLDEFPQVVGNAIKEIVRQGFVSIKT